GYTHLSIGNLLRKEIDNNSSQAGNIKAAMRQGALVPIGVTLEILKNAIVENIFETKGFLIDGFPRNLKQAEAFDKFFAEPEMVILMECSPETMKSRLHKRGEGPGRFDDHKTIINKRVRNYLANAKWRGLVGRKAAGVG
uniref:Adenylate kinase isoenzyme 1-like n=1 Tax=Callorhinchus milii TaxID=7868 RepID=A0A4W3H7X4_CALMI